MARFCNHYEAAFEAFLRARRVAYVAVDESRRSWHGERSLKSVDFIVSAGPRSPHTPLGESQPPENWLVDVKGRHFPAGTSRQYWRNWTTGDELRSLGHWEALLGERFAALLVFAFLVRGDLAPLPPEQLFSFRGRFYGFLAVRLEHYLASARLISPRWNTWSLPASRFRELATGFGELLGTRTATVRHM